MKRITLFVFAALSLTAGAKPQCGIDGVPAVSNGLIGMLSGTATGFLPTEPIYVTVTNNGIKYTTMADRDGKYAILYSDLADSTEVLCWQGFKSEDRLEATTIVEH